MVGNAACIDVLLRVGCSNVNAKDFDNNTALRLAIRGGHAAAAMLLEDAGADVKLRSSFGNTPLYGTREDIFLFLYVYIKRALFTALVVTHICPNKLLRCIIAGDQARRAGV